jgi:hypothetical protein
LTGLPFLFLDAHPRPARRSTVAACGDGGAARPKPERYAERFASSIRALRTLLDPVDGFLKATRKLIHDR